MDQRLIIKDGYISMHRIPQSSKIRIGDVYASRNCGLFEILSYDGRDELSFQIYTIRFLKTGYKRQAKINHIHDGGVLDPVFLQVKRIGEIYDTNSSGKIKIISVVEHNRYAVKFLNTGTIKIAHLSNIINGKVCEIKSQPHVNEINSLVINNSGDIGKILAIYKGPRIKCDIQFLDTGNIQRFRLENVRNGKFRNNSKPVLSGIGYMGDISFADIDNKKLYKLLYRRWAAMLYRCYDPQDVWYSSYGAKGVRVDDRWKCFTNFYHDAQCLPGFSIDNIFNKGFQLDKDKLQMDIPICERIYSKDTCCWLSRTENNQLKYR